MNDIYNNSMTIKTGLAEMLKGGAIMDVTNAEQASIAEQSGACAVMALERIPADIRRDGGVARMSNPDMIAEIQQTVSIPVMAKCRIGHFAEAQILQELESVISQVVSFMYYLRSGELIRVSLVI